MFALEDRPFVRFFTFFALLPDADLRLNSARPRPATSSLTADAGPARSRRIRYTPATLFIRLVSPRQDRLSQV
jgi:hypothetical protein